MRLVLIAVFVFAIASCKKDDYKQPAPPFGFRMPDCSNTIGEGQWEHYNDSERVHIIDRLFHDEVVDTLAVSDVGITSHAVHPKQPGSSKFTYTPSRPLVLVLAVLYGNKALVFTSKVNADSNQLKEVDLSAIGYVKNPGSTIEDAQSGCYRLYYVFGEPYTENGYNRNRVVTKGHFDVYIHL